VKSSAHDQVATDSRLQTQPGTDDRFAALAAYFVASGRVVPGIVVDPDGTARSQWWPLPGADDRELVASLVENDTVEGHLIAATTLAEHVDRIVRTRLHVHATQIVPTRKGRRPVAEAWLASLSADDPRLTGTHDAEKVRALASAVTAWVQSGTPSFGRTKLCLRVHEPDVGTDDQWPLELLVQDALEPSLITSIADLWDGSTLFEPGSIEELLTSLGRLVRLAPETMAVLDAATPHDINLSTDSLLTFARDRIGTLTDIGIGVLLPTWWTRTGRVGIRAKVSGKHTAQNGSVTKSGFGLSQMIDFTWEAALGDLKLTKAELATLQEAADAKRSLVRVRGQWVQVDSNEIAAIMQHVGQRGQATGSELLRTGLGIDTLDAAGGATVVGVTATGWLGELLNDALHATMSPIPTPANFMGTLRPYQERGVGWLSFLGRLGLGACLADDMGLGKTAQLIAALLADPIEGTTLVVCPVSVLGNWARELQRFAPHLSVLEHHGTDRHDHDEAFAERAARHDVVLTTYSLISRDIEHLQAITFARVVLDEAQQVKNPGTAQTKAVARLRAHRRIALTGTPVENRLTELWSLMQLLNPGLLGTFASFKKRFAGPIERDHDEEATALLRRITTPFVLRRLKTDRSIINDLPDKIETTEHCPLTREQATLYQAVVDELLAASEQADGIARKGLVLAGISKLKQVCNHPAHFLSDGSALTFSGTSSSAGHDRSGKLGRMEELLDEIIDTGDKVLIFTQFAHWGDLLAPHLARRYGTEPLWLHGGVPRTKRDKMVEAFGDPAGPPIFMLSLKAGGTGLNLTAASHVIHFDRWWNPAVEDQATDRAYRIGQKRSVLVHKLVSSGTIEERIDEMITNKRSLAKRVVGDGEQWITELSTSELRDVIALRGTEVQ
jgi:hypothetical protein